VEGSKGRGKIGGRERGRKPSITMLASPAKNKRGISKTKQTYTSSAALREPTHEISEMFKARSQGYRLSCLRCRFADADGGSLLQTRTVHR